jgi:hypothetical protein
MHYLWDKSRSVVAVIGALLIAWRLSLAGWPWWAWLPAALLGLIVLQVVPILCWFVYRKLSYQHLARMHKARRKSAED